jgi:hypothetical protein
MPALAAQNSALKGLGFGRAVQSPQGGLQLPRTFSIPSLDYDDGRQRLFYERSSFGSIHSRRRCDRLVARDL